jgi:uracil phosphoribosyltransferase
MLERRDDVDAEVVTHALARDALTRLRSVDTDARAFREGLIELGRVCGGVLAHEVVGTERVEVETPLAPAAGERVAGDVVLVNVLRAATPLVEGLLSVFPDATQGVISASRREEEGMAGGRFPVETTYEKLPRIDGHTVVVADPMLATGSTMLAVLDALADRGEPADLVVLAAVSAPEGLAAVRGSADVDRLLTVAVDDGLDDGGFIVPGLGDAGDRAFGTSGE